jgi:hypothetical protein
VRLLVSRLLRYFVKIDRLIYCREERIESVSFERAYFKSSSLLNSADAIYFKILLRLAHYIWRKGEKERSPMGMVIEEIDIEL